MKVGSGHAMPSLTRFPCPIDPHTRTYAYIYTPHLSDLREQASVREARLHEQLAEVTNDLMVLRLASSAADAAATRLPSSSSSSSAASTGPGPGPLPAEGQERQGEATAVVAVPPASPSKIMRVCVDGWFDGVMWTLGATHVTMMFTLISSRAHPPHGSG